MPLVLAGLAACALGALALITPAGEVRLLLLLAFALVAPGAAVVCHVPLRSRLVAAALTVTASLTVLGLVTATGYWLGAWHPLGVHVGLMLASAVSLVVGAVGGATRTAVDTLPVAVSRPPHGVPPAVRLLPALLIVAALALWTWSLRIVDVTAVGEFGLTAALGWPFVTAVVLVCAALAVELFAGSRTLVLGAAVLALLLLTRATAPLLLDAPQYAWTFKHFGVVELIERAGRVTDPHDIYQQWPAFFTAAAQLSGLAGVAPAAYANWAPLLFGGLDALLVAAMARTLTADRRVVLLAVFVFTAGAWPESNYFSPQAFAYALMLGFYVVVLLWLRAAPHVPATSGRGLWSRLRAALLRGVPPLPGGRSAPPRTAVVAATVVFVALTAAHQLSPYLVLAPLAILAMLRLVRPRLLVVLLATIAAGYALPRLGGVVSDYSIFTGLNPFANGAGNATRGWATPGQAFSALTVRGTCFALWGAALFAALVNRRWLGRVVLPLTLMFAPFALMLVTSYGGEIVYRVYLFALPTCALLAAVLWLGLARRPRRATLVSTAVLAALCLASLQAVHGQFALDRVPTSAVAAAEDFYARAEPGSAVLLAAPDFPARLTADYGVFNVGEGREPALVDEPDFQDVRFGPESVPAVTAWARSFAGAQHYLVVSEPMIRQVHYFGTLPDGSLEGLVAALRTSPEWTVFADDGETTVFRLVTG
jgi:hypothetical protein